MQLCDGEHGGGAVSRTRPTAGSRPARFLGSPDVWYAVIVPPSGAISFTTRGAASPTRAWPCTPVPCTRARPARMRRR